MTTCRYWALALLPAALLLTALTPSLPREPEPAAEAPGKNPAILNNRDYDKAIADATEAIRLDPKLAVAFSYRGAAYHVRREYDRAISDQPEALRLDLGYVKAFIHRASA